MERDGEKGGREGSALCMACGVMSMVMKTKDGREAGSERKCEGNLEARRVLRKTRIEIEMRDER